MVQPKTNLILNSTQMTMETGKEEIITVHEWRRIDPDDRSIIERYILDLPVRLGALANELGVKVRLSSLPANCSGFIHRSYGRKLVTALSCGVFDLLDPVLERYSFDEFGELA